MSVVKSVVCLPFRIISFTGKFLFRRVFRCVCAPCRCAGNCFCPCI